MPAPSTWRFAAGIVAGSALGFAIGRWTAPAAERVELAQAVRQALHEELADFERRAQGVQAPAVSVPAPSVTPENQAAFARAQVLIDGAVASKHWSGREAEELRNLLGKMTQAQRDTVLGRFIPALNRQEVHVDFIGPAF